VKTGSAVSLREALRGLHVGSASKEVAEGLKARVRAFAKERQARGDSLAKIAHELGLRTAMLRWWLEREPRKPRMRPVQVVAEPAVVKMAVVAPNGYRVEGLTLEQVATLMRSLT
jgi:hypothetical protein